jgi:fatty acid hydroxylase domain-containing protein 2
MISFNRFITDILYIHIGLYWIVGVIFLFLDNMSFLNKYKLEHYPSIGFKLYSQTVLIVLFNQLLIIPISYILYPYIKLIESEFSFVDFFNYFIISVIFEEIGFYYTHRLLHTKYLYNYIHKIHHKWVYPIAISAIYCHPIEYIISNLFPGIIGTILYSRNGTVNYSYFLVWNIIAILNTIYAHSGYNFGNNHIYPKHFYHHLVGYCNFGFTGILDYLHGTCVMKKY